MKIPMWQVDSFTADVFSGNPAAVCVLEGWREDRVLQAIAAENNLSETAFLVRNAEGFDLRWFTPSAEVTLCGHATLAAAKVLFDLRGWPKPEVRFETRWRGTLTVEKRGEWLEMDLPALPARPVATPAGLAEALGAEPQEVLESVEDWLAVMDDEVAVRARDVGDPVGMPVEAYRHTRDELIQALGDFVLHLAEHGELKLNS